jgi:hypothetical protein
MAKVKFVGDQPVTVPELGGRLLEPGQIVDVPDAELYRFTQSANWEPGDAKAQKLHDAAHQFHNPDPIDLSSNLDAQQEG